MNHVHRHRNGENQAIYVGPYKQKQMSTYNDDHVQERLGAKKWTNY